LLLLIAALVVLFSELAVVRDAAVEALRRQRYTGKQIAAEVGISPATVSRILQRLGLNKLSAFRPNRCVAMSGNVLVN
jgi:hypothetical protein